jgi:hypothetical protein
MAVGIADMEKEGVGNATGPGPRSILASQPVVDFRAFFTLGDTP